MNEKSSPQSLADKPRPSMNPYFNSGREPASSPENLREKRPDSVTIGKEIDEVYTFVRDFNNMHRFICNVKEVKVLSPKLSHWVMEHDGKRTEHDSEIIAETPLEMFVWRSVGDNPKTGAVSFERAPGSRGTVVSLKMSDDDKPGKFAGLLHHLEGRPEKSQSFVNLRRLKAFLETGEVSTTEGQPSGRDSK